MNRLPHKQGPKYGTVLFFFLLLLLLLRPLINHFRRHLSLSFLQPSSSCIFLSSLFPSHTSSSSHFVFSDFLLLSSSSFSLFFSIVFFSSSFHSLTICINQTIVSSPTRCCQNLPGRCETKAVLRLGTGTQ